MQSSPLTLTGATTTSSSSTSSPLLTENSSGKSEKCCNNLSCNNNSNNIANNSPLHHLNLTPIEEVFLSIKIGSLPQFKNKVEKLENVELLRGFDKDGHTLAHWAAKRENSSFLKYLLEQLPPKYLHLPSNDDVGMYPIHWAVTNGSIPNISFLLPYADVESRDKSGCTPLLIAAQYGHATICAFLLQHASASINALDDSRDGAVHWAAYKGSSEVIGLLCYMQASLDESDVYGHTPLHLSAMRGHTEVVQYILEESEARYDRKYVTGYLRKVDKTGKTPYEVAKSKNKRGCMFILQEWQDRYVKNETQQQKKLYESSLTKIKTFCKQFCSPSLWKLWMGFSSSSTSSTLDEISFSQQKAIWPMGLVVVVMSLAFYLYYFKFLNPSSTGVLYGHLLLHMFTLFCMMLTCAFFALTYKTNPGILSTNSENATLQAITKELRSQYDATLEAFASNEAQSSAEERLCHSCHIVKPPRSKYCRVQRNCILMFDHYCPFVGATIGLYNYPFFFFFLVFATLSEIGFGIAWFIFMKNCTNAQKFDVTTFCLGLTVIFFIIPCLTMVVYHTILVVKNLTTNEHQNFFRYDYLKDSFGRFHNPYDRGLVHNVMSRLCPSEKTYVKPLARISNDDVDLEFQALTMMGSSADGSEHGELVSADANELLTSK